MSHRPSLSPVLRTERLELWRPLAADLDGLVELVAAEETRRHLGASPMGHVDQFERLLRNAGSWSLYGYGIFIVRPRGERDVIASCGIFHSWRGFDRLDDVPEAGWIVRHDCTGRGYAGEAMRAVLAWFDETFGPRRIACMVEADNIASIRLAEKLGFARYGGRAQESGQSDLWFFERLSG